MHFILEPKRIQQINHLRRGYEERRKVDLEVTPSRIGLPTVFGGTDIKNRRAQIAFLEKIQHALHNFLLNEPHIDSWQANLMAVKIMISACLYVQSEIGSSKENSALYCLINEYLGITAENFFDDEDKETCFVTAWKLAQQPDSFSRMNVHLRDSKLTFSRDEWENFSLFLKDSTAKYNTKKEYNKYPITSLSQPLFQEAFAYGGSTVGWLAAELFNCSSAAIGPRLQLTTYVGSAMLCMTSAGPATIGLLAPTIAARIISSFCTISLATVSGRAMGYVGYGAGTIIGYPFDMTFNLLKSIFCSLFLSRTTITAPAALDGIRLVDGVPVIGGQSIRLQLISPETLSKAPPPRLQITDGAQLLIDGEPEEKPSENMLSALRELKDQLGLPEDTVEDTDSLALFF